MNSARTMAYFSMELAAPGFRQATPLDPSALLWFVLLVGAVAVFVSWIRHRRSKRPADAGRRRQEEDVLKYLCKAEAARLPPTLTAVAGCVQISSDAAARLLAGMEQRGLVSYAGGELHLTAAGRQAGVRVIRAHRLWETHLAEKTGAGRLDWHADAEEREHAITPAEADSISARLGHPVRDPHGDEIPDASGVLGREAGLPLTSLVAGQRGRIVHLEDEPPSVYAELVKEGARLGSAVEVLNRDDRSVCLRIDGQQRELSWLLAQNVDVLVSSDPAATGSEQTLATLPLRSRAVVLGLAAECRRMERQRLLDLGFVPGTGVTTELISPTGNTTAYRLRESVIALRREQAEMVKVRPAPTKEGSLP